MKTMALKAFFLMLCSLFFFHTASPTPTHAADMGRIVASNCRDLGNMEWSEMSGWQQQVAAQCDAIEAQKQWQAAYGKLSFSERANAAVYEPL